MAVDHGQRADRSARARGDWHEQASIQELLAGYSATDPPAAGQLQTSPFRSWDFEIAALLLFRADSYEPVLAVLAPVDVVRAHAKPRRHVNGNVVFIRPPLTTAPGVEDITSTVVATHIAM